MVERKKQSWDPMLHPKMLPVTGHRDTTTNITYIPFSDVMLGVMGWEVLPPRGTSFLIYILPIIGEYAYEIRIHAALAEPDPKTDRIIGTVTLPDDLFVGE